METKFNLRQDVYYINARYEENFVECDLCKGAGIVNIQDSDYTTSCPKCLYGEKRGHLKFGDKTVWYPMKETTKIGGIYLEKFANIGKYKENGHQERYVLDCTHSTYSHNMHEADDIFLTFEEAEQECLKRNSKNV